VASNEEGGGRGQKERGCFWWILPGICPKGSTFDSCLACPFFSFNSEDHYKGEAKGF
jgi:hypothetical protein